MILFYFSRKVDIEEIDEQVAYFVGSYIISNGVVFIGFPGLLINGLKYLNSLSTKWLLYFLDNLYPNETQEIIKYKLLINKAESLNLSLRKVKYRTKADFVTQSKYDAIVLILRNFIKVALEINIENMGFKLFVKLLNKDIIIHNFNIDNPNNLDKEDVDLKVITHPFLQPDLTFLLNKDIKLHLKSKDILNEDETHLCESEFMSFPILDIPYVKSSYLTTENLISIRKQIMPNFTAIEDKVNGFVSKTITKKYDDLIEEEFKALHDSILLSKLTIQNEINNNIYLKGIKNAEQEITLLRLNLCVSSTKPMIDYYETIKNISPYMSNALKNKLELTMDLNSCIVFYYFDIISPQIN